MKSRITRLYAIFAMVISLAGCQAQHMTAPPPSFAPPVIRLPGPISLPAGPKPDNPDAAQFRESPIAQANPAGVLSGAALKPKAPSRAWKYIIIHHSDTPYGSAGRFHKAHLARGWDMLGYDFVIGNGTETRDGLIEVGPRWVRQLDGAHTGTPDHEYNIWGIGICLVGTFDEARPTAAQLDSLARLCAYMMKTYNIPPNRILGHRDCKPTNCPGRYMDLNQVRSLARKYLAQMN